MKNSLNILQIQLWTSTRNNVRVDMLICINGISLYSPVFTKSKHYLVLLAKSHINLKRVDFFLKFAFQPMCDIRELNSEQ